MPIDPFELPRLLDEMKRRAEEEAAAEAKKKQQQRAATRKAAAAERKQSPAAAISTSGGEGSFPQRQRADAVLSSPGGEGKPATAEAVAEKKTAPLFPSPDRHVAPLASMLRDPQFLPYAILLMEIMGPPMAERDPFSRWPLTPGA